MCNFAKNFGIPMKRALIFLFLVIALFPYSLSSHAEEGVVSVSLRVCFRRNSSAVDPDYLNNKRELDKFVSEVKEIMSDSTARIQEIHIRSGASPEGPFDNNLELSLMRGANLKDYLQDTLSLPADMFVVEAVGEDWMALKDMVANRNVPDRKEILAVLDKYDKYIKGKPTTEEGGPKKELMDLNGGRTWEWLLKHIFPELRSTGNNILCRYERVVEPEARVAEPEAQRPAHVNDTLVIIHKYVIEVDSTTLPKDLPLKIEIAVPGKFNVADTNIVRTKKAFIDASFSPNIEVKVTDGNENVGVAIDNKVVIPQN